MHKLPFLNTKRPTTNQQNPASMGDGEKSSNDNDNEPIRLGVVDLGTLALRFEVYELSADGQTASITHAYRSMPKLGDQAYEVGAISKSAIAEIVSQFSHISNKARELKVTKLRAVGTSALRDTAGGIELVESVLQATGINIEIISGTEEARLTARGILSREPKLDNETILIDIGGGSTELSLCSARKVIRSISLNLGAERLNHLAKSLSHNNPHPISEPLRTTLHKEIASQIQPIRSWPERGSTTTIVGSSGTARTFGRLAGNVSVISRDKVHQTLEILSNLSHEELIRFPGIEPSRASVTLFGGMILADSMDLLDAEKMQVTKFSLRHGLLQEMLETT